MNLNWWNDEICQITLDELTIFNFPSQITLLAFEVWSQFRTRKLHLTPAAQVMRLANFPRWMFWCARFLEQTFTLDCYIHSYFSAKQRHVSWTKKPQRIEKNWVWFRNLKRIISLCQRAIISVQALKSQLNELARCTQSCGKIMKKKTVSIFRFTLHRHHRSASIKSKRFMLRGGRQNW